MFDPEKVERQSAYVMVSALADVKPFVEYHDHPKGEVVDYDDYAKLLELYRATQNPVCTCGHELSSHAGQCMVNVMSFAKGTVTGCTCQKFSPPSA